MRNFLEKISYSLSRFMYGRYGSDKLSKHMLVLAFILSLFSSVIKFKYLFIVIYGLLFFSIYRIYSKNVYKRQEENEKYQSFINGLKFKKKDKNYLYFKCKTCGQKMRVPRGKGKIEVRCPKCGNKEIKNS